jgi:hypothetical protein
MIRLILALLAICAVLVKINAQCNVSGDCPPADMQCNVGESDLAQGGFCNDADASKGDAACTAYCQKSFGAELIKASCSAERAKNQRECICQLKGQNGGCWGDPHCWTWDGTLFNYQSLQPYYVLKPKKSTPLVPKFEITQSNHPWGQSSAATLDTLHLFVLDWGQDVEVIAPVNQPLNVSLNGKPQAVPGRWSQIKGHRENYIDFKYSDAQHLLITTSFGVTVMVHNAGAYSDVSINIPRHAEFKGNTFGVLASWNDNPADDNLDANGKPCPLTAAVSGDPSGDAAAYGNTYLVPGAKLPTQAELDEDAKHHEEHVKNFNKEHWQHLEKMCDANMNHGEMKHCMKSLGRPAHLVRDCAYDLSHIVEEADQHAFLKAKVESFKKKCKHHQLGEYKHHKRPEHIKNHEPRPCPGHRLKCHEDRERNGRKPHHHRGGDDGREPDEGRGRRPGGRRGGDDGPDDDRRPEGGRGRGHPFLPHHKFGQSKPEHKDKCFKVKEHFKKEAIKLIECLKFEGWFEEEK